MNLKVDLSRADLISIVCWAKTRWSRVKFDPLWCDLHIAFADITKIHTGLKSPAQRITINFWSVQGGGGSKVGIHSINWLSQKKYSVNEFFTTWISDSSFCIRNVKVFLWESRIDCILIPYLLLAHPEVYNLT